MPQKLLKALRHYKQESLANAKGTCNSGAQVDSPIQRIP